MGSINSMLDKYQDWYDRTVAIGGDSFEKFHDHLQNQLRGLSLSGMNILEVGCGKGAVSLYMVLFSGAKRVTALDEATGEGAPAGITQALKDAINLFEIKNLSVVESDVMKNSFEDKYFDVIIANNALHHVVDSGLVYQEPQASSARKICAAFRRTQAYACALGDVEYVGILKSKLLAMVANKTKMGGN